MAGTFAYARRGSERNVAEALAVLASLQPKLAAGFCVVVSVQINIIMLAHVSLNQRLSPTYGQIMW